MEWIDKPLEYFDSKEEWYFSWYLKELVSNEFVSKAIYQPDTIELSRRHAKPYTVKEKGKVKHKEAFLLHPHKYTMDWVLYFTEKAKGKFIYEDNNNPIAKEYPFKCLDHEGIKVYIDIKGGFAGKNNTSAVTFPLNQKWLYSDYGIYVQKIIPLKLFKSTFTPEKYLKTDSGRQARKIEDFKPISINQYIKL